MPNNTITVALYAHVESYPPSLNMIESLSKIFKKIHVLHIPTLVGAWQFPENVQLHSLLKEAISTKETINSSIFYKLFIFTSFAFRLLVLIRKNKSDTILVYDPMPLLSLFFIKILLPKKITFWYHNHDIYEKTNISKFSLGRLAYQIEKSCFSWVNIFSLPSIERLTHFNLTKYTGHLFIIPNYPLVSLFNQFKANKSVSEIIILYQGSISKGKGIEEIIELLPELNKTNTIDLFLKGEIHPQYFERLISLANKKNISQNLRFYAYSDYAEVPKLAASCHIGLAIYSGNDAMNQTLGTASNKIYEYAASGIPILYYKSEHYDKYLSKFKWAFPTDLSKESLLKSIETILSDYDNLSKCARDDFENTYNFEKVFATTVGTLFRN